MNDREWTNQDRSEPWEQTLYQTGSTRPPKSRSGLIAVLLAIVVFLGGIASAMSILNIHLFRQLRAEDPQESPVEFALDAPPASIATEAADEFQEATVSQSDLQLQLQESPQSVANIPQEGGLPLQSIYEKAIASVVSISSSVGTGTGVVLSKDGYIVTNCHVVEGGKNITVLFSDEKQLSAQAVGMDTVSDLAVLRVNAADLIPAEFGDSGALRVGDAVVAIGDPLGIELRGTMTNGIVSAINRDITTGGRTMTLIQTNAALNSGNSGGPLLNCYGQVVGINTMKIGDYMSDAGVEGLGFAIPSTTVKEIVDQLVNQGYVSGRPSIGFTSQTITAFDQLYYRIPQGAYITHVEESSHAAQQGISPGDILLQFEGVRITDADTLDQCLYNYNAGDTVSVVIYRSGRQYSLSLTLDEAQ